MAKMMWRRQEQNHEERQRGQSLVEMAVGFIILTLIAFGLADLGRMYYVIVALEDSAGEAALYLSINPDCWTSGDGSQCADPNNAEYRAFNAGGDLLDWSTATVTVSPPAATDRDEVGDTVTVTITYPFLLITPVIPPIAGVNPLPLTGNATQLVILED